MITTERMNYESNRLFALAELIDTTHTIAFNAVNEGSGDYGAVLQRVHELLFAAYEVANCAAHDLSDLIGECVRSQPVQQPVTQPATVDGRGKLIALRLRSYTLRALADNGIRTRDDLLRLTETDLIKMKGIGIESMKDIVSKLKDNDLSLRPEAWS